MTALLAQSPSDFYSVRVNDESIGILAARHAGVRAALEGCGIDYYCAGDRTIADAALTAGMSEAELRSQLEKAREKGSTTEWQGRSLRDMVTYLEHEHHQILRNIIFHSAMLLNEAASLDGAGPATTMRSAFRHLCDELIMHIEKEEHFFFPMLLSIELARETGLPSPVAVSEIQKNVATYVLQHAAISNRLSQLRAESAALEQIDSLIVRGLLDNLEALERHLHEYLNLENYVVFPRAIALEDDLQRAPRALAAAGK